MTHTLNIDISTAVNGEILIIPRQKSDLAISIHAVNLDQPIQIDLMWSNDKTGTIPLVDTEGTPQSIELPAGANSVNGKIYAFFEANYIHLVLNKLTATVGNIVKVETNF